MTAGRWAEIKAVVATALDTPTADRRAYLDDACGTDAELRREVESLLVAAQGPDSLPAARAAVAAASASYAIDAESILRGAIEQPFGDRYEIIRPQEIERLTLQLSALDESPDRDGTDRGELRELVRHQLDVVRRMQGRYELAAQRSGHLFYLLRGLWAQLCLLRNVTVGGPVAIARQGDQVRALCAEIDRALEAGDSAAAAKA